MSPQKLTFLFPLADSDTKLPNLLKAGLDGLPELEKIERVILDLSPQKIHKKMADQLSRDGFRIRYFSCSGKDQKWKPDELEGEVVFVLQNDGPMSKTAIETVLKIHQKGEVTLGLTDWSAPDAGPWENYFRVHYREPAFVFHTNHSVFFAASNFLMDRNSLKGLEIKKPGNSPRPMVIFETNAGVNFVPAVMQDLKRALPSLSEWSKQQESLGELRAVFLQEQRSAGTVSGGGKSPFNPPFAKGENEENKGQWGKRKPGDLPVALWGPEKENLLVRDAVAFLKNRQSNHSVRWNYEEEIRKVAQWLEKSLDPLELEFYGESVFFNLYRGLLQFHFARGFIQALDQFKGCSEKKVEEFLNGWFYTEWQNQRKKLWFDQAQLKAAREYQRNALGEKEQHLVRASLELEQSRSAVERQEKLIQAQTEEVERLSQELSQEQALLQQRQTELEMLSEEFQATKSTLEIAQGTLETKENLLLEREGKIEQLKEQVQNLNAQVQDYGMQLHRIYTSLSWKIVTLYSRVKKLLLPNSGIARKIYDQALALLKSGYAGLKQSVSPHCDLQEKWLAKHSATPKAIKSQHRSAHNFDFVPCISLVVPVSNCPPALFMGMLESVLAQSYENWEVCLGIDNTLNSSLWEVLEKYTRDNPKMRVKLLPESASPGKLANAALSLAEGRYFGFLGPTDSLTPDALFEIVARLNQNRQLEFFYTDEAVENEDGRIEQILCRPEFSENFLLSTAYFNHFVVVKREIIQKIKGFDEEFKAYAHYDLFLRALSHISEEGVAHIPKVLYFWKKDRQSVEHQTHFPDEYAKKAVKGYLDRKQISGAVKEGMAPGCLRIKYEITDAPRVSVILAEDKGLSGKFVETLKSRAGYEFLDVLVVRSSQSGESGILSGSCKVLHLNEKFNLSRMYNVAAREAAGDYFIFLGNSLEVKSEDWVPAFLEHGQRQKIGVVGGQVVTPDQKIKHAGIVLGLGGKPRGDSHRSWNLFKSPEVPESGYLSSLCAVREYSAVSGSCLMVGRDLFKEVGGFDESLSHHFLDVDLCLKIRKKGYLVLYTPYACFVDHSLNGESQEDLHVESAYFAKKWESVLVQPDPYYSPNLTRSKYDFSLEQ